MEHDQDQKDQARQDRDYDLEFLNISRSLGPLELEVMNIIWDEGEATVHDIYKTLSQRREIAYTTALSTTTNLAKKGLLRRRLEGKSYVYWPTVSKPEFVNSRVGSIVKVLLDHFSESATQHFVDRFARGDDQKLAELEKLLAEKKRQARQDSE